MVACQARSAPAVAAAGRVVDGADPRGDRVGDDDLLEEPTTK
jgi:hypothetical protein